MAILNSVIIAFKFCELFTNKFIDLHAIFRTHKFTVYFTFVNEIPFGIPYSSILCEKVQFLDYINQ